MILFMKRLFVWAFFLIGFVSLGYSELVLSNVFTRNMVLQREAKNPVFGTAAPGATVNGTFNGQAFEATAEQNGAWLGWLEPMPANREGADLTVESGGQRATVQGIVVGDVWYAAGDYGLVKGMNQGEAKLAKEAPVPDVRLYLSRMGTSPYPLMEHTTASMYSIPDEKSYKRFSPVSYAFAETISAVSEVDVPIGFFNASGRFGLMGALPASAAAHLKHPANQDLALKMREAWVAAPEGQAAYAAYAQAMRKWIAHSRERVAAGLQLQAMPKPPNAEMEFGDAFNARVHPIRLFPIRGVIWYVFDRTNYSDSDQGIDRYEALIKSWREAFNNPELPFYIVQHHYPSGVVNAPNPQGGLTLMQQELLSVPHTGLVVTYDLHDRKEWDLANRYDAGRRLALWALRDVYGQPVEPMGPAFKRFTVADGRALIEFDYVGDALMAADKDVFGPPVNKGGARVDGFMIAGADGNWHWAEAELAGKDQVLVWSEKVADPARVAYAVNNSPEKPNLYSGNGLPALPFSQGRTE